MFGCRIVKGNFIEEKTQYTIDTYFSSGHVFFSCLSAPLECKFREEKDFFPGLLLYF